MRAITDSLSHWLTDPALLRPLFSTLRQFRPVLVLGNKVVVSRHRDVLEVLLHPDNFTISEVNAQNINRHDGPFILGMDASEQYNREVELLRAAVRPQDLAQIRDFVKTRAADLTNRAKAEGRIDVVNGFARVVAAGLVNSYFGVSYPDGSQRRLMGWLRHIFHDVFLNFTNDREIRDAALNASSELQKHLDADIAKRNEGSSVPGSGDDVLGRLLAQKSPQSPWLDDDTVRRNLSGLIVGAVETTSKFVALAIDELLRRPNVLQAARLAALGGDVETVRRYAYEAARFNPHAPFVIRYCKRETTLAAGTPRARHIKAGSFVLVGTLSAMFDPEGFPHPDEFRIDRETEYLHFGEGMHRCFGYHINAVQIPELIAALLRLPNLRRARGRDGYIDYAGPFPDRLMLEFDRHV